MSNHCIIKATFNILPQESDKANYYIDDPEVGMNELGNILKQVFPHTLYKYQIEAMKTVLAGNDLFLTVGTGAGKTEVFMFPILKELLEEKATNAIIIYPTKQLAADQEQRLAHYCNQILEATGRTITYSRYNGDLSKQDLEQIEKKKPQILLATLDKLFYRCFKDDKHGFLDWIKQTDVLVLDEIHAGSGGYLTHIREFIDVFKKINPKLRVILASATVKDVNSFRDNFLPSAKIVQAVGKRGLVRVMILPKASLEKFIFERIDPYLQRTGGVCLVFVDSIQKVSQLVATFNERLMKRTGLPLEVVKLNSPFVCINSQLTEQDKTNIHKRIKNGSLRFLFSTSLLELGMDLPKVEHIINIGWPITGKNGLLQRFGRLRFRDVAQKKNFTIILDTEQPLDNFYLENYRIIKTILEENIAEQILFDSKSLQRLKAFILFRICMGLTTNDEILSYCQTAECEHKTKTAITMLLASGIIRTQSFDTNSGKQELVIADERELHFFIRNHKIRSIEQRWLVIEQENKIERVVGEIEEQRILRMALPGNLLFQGSHGDVYRVLQIVEGKVFVEKLAINKSTIEYNKLKAPIFQISQQARVQKIGNLIIRYGRMVIQKETTQVIRYSRTGEKIEPTHQHKQSYHWQERTSGMLVEVIFQRKKVGYKIKQDTLTLLRDLLLKSAEITLHISEPSFRTAINVYEGKLAIYDKGGELGNTAYLFREFHKVMKQARKILQSTSNNQSSQAAIFPFLEQTSDETLGMVRPILTEKTKGDLET
ncbi:MAG: DEAD/DEAH box helicase [Candidatus Heimdallarchaeota archaeon]|nr:DEAD/DEAH box helicase [Candidatus Heimdallarchaeota archaeon]